jgi:hypothetical protein
MEQAWFEMQDITGRYYDDAVWIPLRRSGEIIKEGDYGKVGFKEEYLGISSLAVFESKTIVGDNLGWQELGVSGYHFPYISDHHYFSVDMQCKNGDIIGRRLVIEQIGSSLGHNTWHLNQDLVVALGLLREGDRWVCVSRGYEIVAKLTRKLDGAPESIEIKAEYLKDYLFASRTKLRICSYRSRVIVAESADNVVWSENPVVNENATDRWEGRKMEIHEGGHLYGSEVAVLHVGRTDVDFEKDVPNINPFDDSGIKSEQWVKKFHGKKLIRIEGELWRNEWVNPGTSSPIVLGDERTVLSSFIIDASGKSETKETMDCETNLRWLWFRPGVINELLTYRGSNLAWYTMDTGSISCSPGYGVHFGVNSIGYINVLFQDISSLPDWQQKIWAGFNTAPDGKVSMELLMSQMEARPANTLAPESYLEKGILRLNNATNNLFGVSIVRITDDVLQILERCYRFRSINDASFYALAKDLTRVLIETIDKKALETIQKPSRKDLGSLKHLEEVLSNYYKQDFVKDVVAPFFGLYDLRKGDAHLPSKDLETNFHLVGIDNNMYHVQKGYQLIKSCVDTLHGLAELFEHIAK